MAFDLPLISVSEPFPISKVTNRYFLYDINTITYIRREYHICGVMIGGIPQIPQQNVFLGIPLELMPEEARLLVEKKAGYIVDDVESHDGGTRGLQEAEKEAFRKDLELQGKHAAKRSQKLAKDRQDKALKGMKDRGEAIRQSLKDATVKENVECSAEAAAGKEDSSLFDDAQSLASTSTQTRPAQEWAVTPTTSIPPLQTHPIDPPLPLPETPTSYPLFKHLHTNGYYMSPGLRFGCQYSVYPGDPLRFHSHFLAVGAGWDEELSLLDIIGGGRLGTGVKKGYLLGGTPDSDAAKDIDGKVRTFCIEWGGM
jgi:tRNA-splicing endonuclease subunit Sen34